MHHAGAPGERSTQADRHPHPVRPPLVRQLLQHREVGLPRKPVSHANSLEQSRLGRRKLVDRAQRPQPHQLGAKLTNSLESLEALQRLVAWHRAERLRFQITSKRRATERVQVLDLAPEQALERFHLDEKFRGWKAVETVAVNVDRRTVLSTHALLDGLALAHR